VEMAYPQDPNAPPEQTINCRCSFTTRVDLAALRGESQAEPDALAGNEDITEPEQISENTEPQELESVPEDDIIQQSDYDREIAELEQYVKDRWGVQDVNLQGLDVEAVRGQFEAMDRAIQANPELKGAIRSISGKDIDGMMTTNLSGDIFFNNVDFAQGNLESLKTKYARGVESGFHVKGTTWEHMGVHELGHRFEAEMIHSRSVTYATKVRDWNSGNTADRVVNDAIKGVRLPNDVIAQGVRNIAPGVASQSNQELMQLYRGFHADGRRATRIASISRYASTSSSEAIADAFLDSTINGNNANPVSLRIMDAVRRG